MLPLILKIRFPNKRHEPNLFTTEVRENSKEDRKARAYFVHEMFL